MKSRKILKHLYRLFSKKKICTHIFILCDMITRINLTKWENFSCTLAQFHFRESETFFFFHYKLLLLICIILDKSVRHSFTIYINDFDCSSYNLDERFFMNNKDVEVLQLRWHPASPKDSHLLVLLSNNSIRYGFFY